MSEAVATRGVIRSQAERAVCSHRTWIPSSSSADGAAALESAEPGDGRGTSRYGAGGRGVARSTRCRARVTTPGETRPAFARGAKFQPAAGAQQGPSPAFAEGCLGHSVPHAQRSARASRLKLRRPFCWSDFCRNSQHVYSRLSCRLQRLRNLRLLQDTNKSTDFHVFPKPFPTAGLTAQLHKQSPVGATRQLLCSRAAIPCRRHFLEKVRKNRIFVVFLRKEKTKKLRSVCKEHCWARSRNCKLMRC